jgi:hypothetical protein
MLSDSRQAIHFAHCPALKSASEGVCEKWHPSGGGWHPSRMQRRMPEGCQVREYYSYFLKECHFLSHTPAGRLQGHAGHLWGGAVFNAGCRHAWRATLNPNLPGTRRTPPRPRDTRRTAMPTKPPKLPPKCMSCGANRSDPPSRLCLGCQAYAEHQR